jgi:hypothetical protein
VNVRWLLLLVAAGFGYQSVGAAVEHSASSASATASRQSAPAIRFLRPIRGEHFFDFPVFLQVDVAGFHLAPPDKQRSKTLPVNTGYIRYSMDDYPVCGTDETQVMIGKFLFDRYLPVGWHVVKAELVDVNGNPLNPPVIAETAVFSGHAAAVETDHVQNGSVAAELNAQELYKMRLQLQELQTELLRIRTGNSGYVPVPVSGNEHRAE